MKIDTYKAIIFMWVYMKLQLHMFCETVLYFESEVRLGKVNVFCQGV